MTQATDNGTGSCRFAGIHAGAGERYDRDAPGIQASVLVELCCTDPRGHADAFTEIGKVQHSAQDFTVEWRTDIRVGGITNSKDATYVQDLNRSTDSELLR